MSKTILKECGFVKENGTACDKSAKFGRRCGTHKGKRNKGKMKKKAETKPLKLNKAEPKKEVKASKSSKQSHTSTNMKFWYMGAKKFVLIPRSECKIKRSKGRGGDQVIGMYQGKKLATYVPRGFEL